MIVEMRINKNGTTPWLDIDPLKFDLTKSTAEAREIAIALSEASKSEVRWNYENDLNGNYVGTEYKFQDNFEIEKTLVVSTGHITYEDSLRLAYDANNRGEEYSLIVNESLYAWDVHLDQDSECIEHEDKNIRNNYSGAFANVIQKARELGCHWVKFDQDGSEYECFEKFDWEEQR